MAAALDPLAQRNMELKAELARLQELEARLQEEQKDGADKPAGEGLKNLLQIRQALDQVVATPLAKLVRQLSGLQLDNPDLHTYRALLCVGEVGPQARTQASLDFLPRARPAREQPLASLELEFRLNQHADPAQATAWWNQASEMLPFQAEPAEIREADAQQPRRLLVGRFNVPAPAELMRVPLNDCLQQFQAVFRTNLSWLDLLDLQGGPRPGKAVLDAAQIEFRAEAAVDRRLYDQLLVMSEGRFWGHVLKLARMEARLADARLMVDLLGGVLPVEAMIEMVDNAESRKALQAGLQRQVMDVDASLQPLVRSYLNLAEEIQAVRLVLPTGDVVQLSLQGFLPSAIFGQFDTTEE